MKAKIIIILSLSVLVSFLITCNKSENPIIDNDADNTIAITNGFLIDGTGADPMPDATIIIQGKHIKSVGTASTLNIPEGAKIIDTQDSYVLPGLMNTHVHSGYVKNNLQVWANSGVTTVRDIGNLNSSPEQGFFTRDLLLIDNKNARLVAAGPLVTTVGGYGNYPVSSPGDAEQKVNGLIDAGADLIKIAIEDNLQGRSWPMLSMDEIKMVCQTAHNKNKRVAAHISRANHLYMAIKGGVDDVDHMVINTLPDSLISLMIQKNIYWVPTLELWEGVSNMYSINWIEIAKLNLQRFVQAGGKVALGTDYDGYVTPFDLGMPITEMKLMLEAGMTPMQILVAATMHSSYVCGLENELGTIEEGKIADIIIVDGNPLENLEVLLNVQKVFHNGVIIKD
jgi:imidazolonepropionase-like amidohydrolase